MLKPNLEEIRAQAENKKLIARQKIEISKQLSSQRKALKDIPNPNYVSIVDRTGNAQQDSLADLNEIQKGFRSRAKDEGKRFALATDTEYWTCLCFQTRGQKEVFLAALNILQFGDKYIDGQLVAKELGITLPSAEVPYNTSSKIDPKWIEFTN